MRLYALHPIYALAGISLCTAVAFCMACIVPYYRHELNIENATRLTPLDGLRGILCFSVLFHHAAETHHYVIWGTLARTTSAFYILLGETAVALFFCTTGFLFWSRVLDRDGQINTFSFLRARFFRIAPLYAFSGILALALVGRQIHWASLSAVRDLLTLAMMGVRPWPDFGSVHLGQVDAGVTWTLPFEWAFYFALPALASMTAGKGKRALPLLALAVFIVFGNGPYVYFLSGMIAAHAARRPAVVRVLKRRRVGAGVLFLLLLMPLVSSDGFGYKSILMTTCVFIPIACGNSLLGILNTRGLRLMGIISYSVYLLHGIVIYMARPLLAQTSHADDPNGTRYWACICMLSLIVLFVSMITYRWIEWPFIELEKKRRNALPPAHTEQPLPAAASIAAPARFPASYQAQIERMLRMTARFFLLR